MTRPRAEPRAESLFAAAALVLFGGQFLYLAIGHVLYPGFLEPLESDVLRHIQLVSQHRPPYPAPGADFISTTLMPFYYYVSAPLYAVFGDSFRGPRLVSAASALASAGLVAWIAWKASRTRWVPALAAALFFSAYRLMDACLTCAQPDALALLLVLAGYCFWIHGERPVDDLAWILLLGLAAWTKLQGAAHLVAVAGLSLAGWPRRRALPGWGIVLGVALVGPVTGWWIAPHLGAGFMNAVIREPRRWAESLTHPALRTAMLLACFVPFAAVLALVAVRSAGQEGAGRGRRELSALLLLNLLIATGTVAVSGSSNNHYVPFIALTLVAAALGAGDLCGGNGTAWAPAAWLCVPAAAAFGLSSRFLGGHAGGPVPPGLQLALVFGSVLVAAWAWRSAPARRGPVLALWLAAAQMAAGYTDLSRFTPSPRFEADRAALRAELDRLGGAVVWWPYGNVPRELTGSKLRQAPSEMAVQDIRRQHGDSAGILQELAPLDSLLRSRPGLLILADSKPLDGDGWDRYASRLELVRDYGPAFQGVRQSAVHWYGGGGYPRYLYRAKPDP